MTSRNRQRSHFFYWRLRHFIRLTLSPALLPRLRVSAVFLSSPLHQGISRSWQPA
jgi:hypothetical protein